MIKKLAIFSLFIFIGCNEYKNRDSLIEKKCEYGFESFYLDYNKEFSGIERLKSVRSLEDGNLVAFYSKKNSEMTFKIFNVDNKKIMCSYDIFGFNQDFMIRDNLLYFSSEVLNKISVIEPYSGKVVKELNRDALYFTGNEDKGGAKIRISIPAGYYPSDKVFIEQFREDYSIYCCVKKLKIPKTNRIVGATVGRWENEILILLSSEKDFSLTFGFYDLKKDKLQDMFFVGFNSSIEEYTCSISPNRKTIVFYKKNSKSNNVLEINIVDLSTRTIQKLIIDDNFKYLSKPDWFFDSTAFLITDVLSTKFIKISKI